MSKIYQANKPLEKTFSIFEPYKYTFSSSWKAGFILTILRTPWSSAETASPRIPALPTCGCTAQASRPHTGLPTNRCPASHRPSVCMGGLCLCSGGASPGKRLRQPYKPKEFQVSKPSTGTGKQGRRGMNSERTHIPSPTGPPPQGEAHRQKRDTAGP